MRKKIVKFKYLIKKAPASGLFLLINYLHYHTIEKWRKLCKKTCDVALWVSRSITERLEGILDVLFFGIVRK